MPPRTFGRRSAVALLALMIVTNAITVFARAMRPGDGEGCTWPADSGDPLPPCPTGPVLIFYACLVGGVVALVAYANWGSEDRPAPGFAHLARFPPVVGGPGGRACPAEGGWAGAFVMLEASVFALGPLAFLFFRDMRHNMFWSDGQEFFPDKENPPPPVPPADRRLKVRPVWLHLAAIGAGIATGLRMPLPELQ